ncbi:hypothetical protein Golob_001743, partial [Gossypium lobatum]|nr:hypothetical protein [Gossypium lobatum]
IEFTRSQIIAAIPGSFFCAWYASQKHWLANNILGLAFCIQGIEMLSLGSFKTGAILLVRIGVVILISLFVHWKLGFLYTIYYGFFSLP